MTARWTSTVAAVAGCVASLICAASVCAHSGGQTSASNASASAAAAATRQSAEVLEIESIRAGLGGRFKVGCWTPLAVTLRAGATSVTGRVEVTMLDGDATPSRVHAPAEGDLTLAAGETKTVSLSMRIGQLKSPVTVAFRAGEQVLASRTFTSGESPELSGVLPSAPALILTIGSKFLPADVATERATILAEVGEVAQLPTDWWNYEGVDTVIITTADDAMVSQLNSGEPQLAALDQWVRMGGHLILSVGRQAKALLAPGAPLARLVPGKLQDPDPMVPLRQAAMLETYAQSSEPLETGAGVTMQVPKLVNVRGRIEAFAGNRRSDLPLVVRTPHGFGEVVVITVDLDRAPLVDWAARPLLLDRMLGRPRNQTARESGSMGQVTTLGFVDTAGQLRGALDQFAGVKLVPFWLVAVLVLAYIACIGPLDYFVVKRVLGRMESTWFTSAATILAFGALAYFLAYGVKGRELRVNQIDLVDWDVESSQVRGTSWATLFSPQTDVYGLSMPPRQKLTDATQPAGRVFSWMGLPGSGFGGMDSPVVSVSLFAEPYDFSGDLTSLERVPIAVWSSKAFVNRWWTGASAQVQASLGDNGRLIGTVESHLEAPLDNCVLIYERWAYPLGTFKPGQKVNLERDIDPQRVDTFFRHVTVQGDRSVSVPYDRSSFDIERILEIMSAHELAGGTSYTGLVNDAYPFVDLSRLVANGRAVLIGRASQAAVELERDGKPLDAQTPRWVYHRFVFPVEDKSAAAETSAVPNAATETIATQ